MLLVIAHNKPAVLGHESFKILIQVCIAVYKSTITNTVILNSTLQQHDRWVWTGFSWLRIGTSGRLLGTR
jgi:hypothetical protein